MRLPPTRTCEHCHRHYQLWASDCCPCCGMPVPPRAVPARVAADRAATLVALEQACAEYEPNMRAAREHCRSDRECVKYGASTGRVAFILSEPEARVRARLQAMARLGDVMREPGNPVRWWPKGFHRKLLDTPAQPPA